MLEFWGDGFNERGKLLDGDRVVYCEVDVAPGSVAAGGESRFTAKKNGNVRSEILHALLLIDLKAYAQSDQKDDRSDAPDDAKHGQKAAKLCGPERG